MPFLYKARKCIHTHSVIGYHIDTEVMEGVGSVVKGLTKYFNTMYVYKCVRTPGFVYEFNHRKNNSFTCTGCAQLKKTRSITIVSDEVVASDKHPEDDHVCQPISETGMLLSSCNVIYWHLCSLENVACIL